MARSYLYVLAVGFAVSIVGCDSGGEAGTVYQFNPAPNGMANGAGGAEPIDLDSGRPGPDAFNPSSAGGAPGNGAGGVGGANSGGQGSAGGSGAGGSSGGAGAGAGGSGGTPGPGMGGQLGTRCDNNSDCIGGTCIDDFPGGYCSSVCETADDCGGNGSCWTLGDQSLCLLNCAVAGECRVNEGYTCDSDNTCYPGGDMPAAGGMSPIGAACNEASDCVGPNNACLPAQSADGPTGFVDGYCYQTDCGDDRPCPAGSECFTLSDDGSTACLASCAQTADCRAGYACQEAGACLPGCMGDESCPDGLVCSDEGTCVEPPCTPDSCPAGTFCGDRGRCIVDVGEVPAGPVPGCDNVVSWACQQGCDDLIPFEPVLGPGYTNYPLNGETSRDQYRSFARRDTMMLVKYAAAKTECLAQNWAFGLPGMPLGLGDMSEGDGSIPGTRDGRPGHPPSTHENGFDMDIAYYQMTSPNNHLRSICSHTVNGRDQYHCTEEPNNFDPWRTALFLALLHDSPQLRIIGVDGRVGQLVDAALDGLCEAGYLQGRACAAGSRLITYEVTDMGRGWFRFHHHHFHMSLTTRQRAGLNGVSLGADQRCLLSNCGSLPPPSLDPRRHHEHHHERTQIAVPHRHQR